MPALPEVAAMVDAGVVVNVAALSTENDYSEWLDAMKAQHDSVLIVPAAGIGWEEYEPGKVRPPQPYPSWVWDGEWWQAPVPQPEGNYTWDEDTQGWLPVAG